MTTPELAVLARLLASTDRFVTSANHLDNREQLNHLGVCSQRRSWIPSDEVVPDGTGWRAAGHTLSGECAPSCIEFVAVRAAAQAIVDAADVRQLVLLEAVS